jgi:lysophospholipase L1-like esterase
MSRASGVKAISHVGGGRRLAVPVIGLLVVLTASAESVSLAQTSRTAKGAASRKPQIDAQEAYQRFLRNVSVRERMLTINAGTYLVLGREVRVLQRASFDIAPAEVIAVENESITLGKDKPASWSAGRALRGVKAAGINALGSYVAGSLAIRKTPEGPPLTENKEYLIDPEFGMVGTAPGSSIAPDEAVYASYRYSLMRIDSVFIDVTGRPVLVKGRPDISVPVPPEVPWEGVRLCNIFRPCHARTVEIEHLFPIIESAESAETQTTRGRLPKAMEKIKAGRPLTVVCWGDSVTTGGDASRGSTRYVEQFRSLLLDRYENVTLPINIINVSYGGTGSQQWLRLGPFNDAWFKTVGWPADQINFDRILAAKPDVLTIEFVNDAGMDDASVERTYSEILRRLEPLGTEVVLITPHFTAMQWMNLKSLRGGDERAYVNALYRFADRHKVAVADASARWAHLWKEGLPYITLLRNTVNHPDDRGHRLFAEELLRCFE